MEKNHEKTNYNKHGYRDRVVIWNSRFGRTP
jgi:hypothetical protein